MTALTLSRFVRGAWRNLADGRTQVLVRLPDGSLETAFWAEPGDPAARRRRPEPEPPPTEEELLEHDRRARSRALSAGQRRYWSSMSPEASAAARTAIGERSRQWWHSRGPDQRRADRASPAIDRRAAAAERARAWWASLGPAERLELQEHMSAAQRRRREREARLARAIPELEEAEGDHR